jgi:hypothetical protein
MQSIKWSIVESPPAHAGVLGLRMEDTQDANAVWPFYFTGINAASYPAAIDAAVQEIGSSGEYSGVTFPDDLDEWDLTERAPFPSNMVELYQVHFGRTIVLRDTFYTMLLAFAERLLERPGQPAEWYTAMHTALDKLRAKMTADSAGAPLQ